MTDVNNQQTLHVAWSPFSRLIFHSGTKALTLVKMAKKMKKTRRKKRPKTKRLLQKERKQVIIESSPFSYFNN